MRMWNNQEEHIIQQQLQRAVIVEGLYILKSSLSAPVYFSTRAPKIPNIELLEKPPRKGEGVI